MKQATPYRCTVDGLMIPMPVAAMCQQFLPSDSRDFDFARRLDAAHTFEMRRVHTGQRLMTLKISAMAGLDATFPFHLDYRLTTLSPRCLMIIGGHAYAG